MGAAGDAWVDFAKALSKVRGICQQQLFACELPRVAYNELEELLKDLPGRRFSVHLLITSAY